MEPSHAIIVPLVIAIVQAIKQTEWVPDRLLALLSLVIGTGLSLALGNDLTLSLVIGASSTGFYEAVKRPTEE